MRQKEHLLGLLLKKMIFSVAFKLIQKNKNKKKRYSHEPLFLFSISINFFKVKRLFLGCCKVSYFMFYNISIYYVR